MSGINFLGTYSGIDSSVVDQLIAAEATKKVTFTNKIEKYTSEKNAWNDVNSRLDNLFKKLETLQKTDTFESKTVSHEDERIVSVTADQTVQPAEYRLHIQQIATATRLIGEKAAIMTGKTTDDALELAGSVTITNHDNESFVIDIGVEDGLKQIAKKINEQSEESGVQASIVDNRLILTDQVLGERNFLVDGEIAGTLGLTSTAEAGQSAVFTIDGLEVTRDTNSIDDVIEGMTFNLKTVHADAAETVVRVESDVEKTTTAMKEFVEQYNSTMSFIKSQLDVGDPSAENNKTGALVGDSMIMRVQSGLRNLLTGLSEDTASSVRSASDVGIEVDRYGVATFDEAVFKDVLQENPADLRNFFYQQETVTETEIVDGETTTKSKFVKSGLTENLRSFIDTFISGTTGLIKNKNETYDKMIDDMNERVEQFNSRLEKKRARLIQQFSTLDTAMMQAESQMSFMFSQLGMSNPTQ